MLDRAISLVIDLLVARRRAASAVKDDSDAGGGVEEPAVCIFLGLLVALAFDREASLRAAPCGSQAGSCRTPRQHRLGREGGLTTVLRSTLSLLGPGRDGKRSSPGLRRGRLLTGMPHLALTYELAKRIAASFVAWLRTASADVKARPPL